MAAITLLTLPGVRVGAVGQLVISAYTALPDVQMLMQLEEVQSRHAAQSGGKVLLCNVVTVPSLSAPPSEVREHSAKMQERLDAYSLGSATVLRMGGLSAVVARSFMAALAFVTHARTPNRVFKDTDEAITWLLTLPGTERLARERTLAADVKAFTEG